MATQQAQFNTLIGQASAQVKQARSLDADWPAGTAEAADTALDACLAGLIPAPEPGPAPPRDRVQVVYGSYPTHDPARDGYPGLTDEQVQWGPHHGIRLFAPAAGLVQALSFPTPINHWLGWSSSRKREIERFFMDWTCWLPPEADLAASLERVLYGQTMFVMVYIPDGGWQSSIGPVRLLVGGHVHQSIHTGRVHQGDLMAVTWDSGIRFETSGNPVARAAHFHSAPSASGRLLPNGDIDGLAGFELLGWQPTNIGAVPGPTDYAIANHYCAGRLYRDFQEADRDPPPMPG